MDGTSLITTTKKAFHLFVMYNINCYLKKKKRNITEEGRERQQQQQHTVILYAVVYGRT